MHRNVMAGLLAAGAAGLSVLGAAPALAADPGFTARVSNAYYPLLPGMRWEYRGVKDGRPLRDVVVVTKRTERVGDVPCAAVLDRGYVDGRLAESTIDWFAQDAAEDRFKVVSRKATIGVPFGTFRGRALMTEEWTALEPGVRDAKWYVKGIGQVREATLKGGDERAELVSFRRR